MIIHLFAVKYQKRNYLALPFTAIGYHYYPYSNSNWAYQRWKSLKKILFTRKHHRDGNPR